MVAEVKTVKFYEGVVVDPPDTTQPVTVGNATLSAHALAKGQLSALVLAQVSNVEGTYVAPVDVTITGIAFVSTSIFSKKFVRGSGGAIDLSAVANPIGLPTYIDQRLELVFASDASPITLDTIAGLVMNGAFVGTAERVLNLTAKSLTEWVESSRS